MAEGSNRRHRAIHRGGDSLLSEMCRQNVPAVLSARVGRFYGEGLRWALSLPLPELLYWYRLMDDVTKAG